MEDVPVIDHLGLCQGRRWIRIGSLSKLHMAVLRMVLTEDGLQEDISYPYPDRHCSSVRKLLKHMFVKLMILIPLDET